MLRPSTEAVRFRALLEPPSSRISPESPPNRSRGQQWTAWLLDRYSSAYASNQYRALQQFFKWLAAEDELPDPTAGLQSPPVPQQLIPVFASQELARLDQACADRSFAQRRHPIIAVFKATGIRLAELAGLRYDPGDPRHSDIDLWQREITVRGKGGKPRIVRIGHRASRSLDRYLRAGTRHRASGLYRAFRPCQCAAAGVHDVPTLMALRRARGSGGPRSRARSMPRR